MVNLIIVGTIKIKIRQTTNSNTKLCCTVSVSNFRKLVSRLKIIFPNAKSKSWSIKRSP